MANLNNVVKSIESLNSLSKTSNVTLDQASRKVEKTNHCLAIAGGISSSTVKNTRQFSQVLGLSVKTLLSLCDDEDPDIRTVADECLNRIIRSTTDGNICKIQFELYNEIQRNGSWRSLRAALYRFGLLSHMIKPVRGKPYISNLIPCIVAISKRSEEAVIDTLAQSVPLILKSLGAFMTDKNVKTLLKSFYPSLASPQSIFRRNAANMILATCLYCRKPRVVLFYVLRCLIDTMIPVSQQQEEDSHRIVGIFGCVKIMLPHLDKSTESNNDTPDCTFDCLVQIYKLCLRYIQRHSDHNILNATMETLAQLLRSNNEKFITLLTESNGISDSGMINSFQATLRLSSSNSDFDESVDVDCKLVEEDKKVDVEEAEEAKTVIKIPEDVEKNSDENQDVNCDNIEKNSEKSTDNHDKDQISLKESLEKLNPRKIFNIGSFTDQDVPLKYLCRYLASSFLLTGTPGQLISDDLFRVSVKSLALTCIGTIVRLYPDIFLETLEKITDKNDKNNCQMISDVLLFADHPDPQLRGNVTIILGYYLNTIYLKYRVSYERFRSKHDNDQLKLENLIDIFVKALEDESAATCRQSLTALSTCLTSLLESPDSFQAINLIYKLLPLADNIYFLVKSDLVQVLSELPFITIKYLTGNSKFQNDVMSIFVKMLEDQDPRVRNSTTEAIVKFIETAYFEKPYEDEITRKATCYTEKYLTRFIFNNPLDNWAPCDVEHKSFINGLVEPFFYFYSNNDGNFYHRENIEDALSIIIGSLVDQLFVNPSKYSVYGCFQTLSQLSQVFPTTLYPNAWDCSLTKALIKRNNTKINSSNRSINSECNAEISAICQHLSSTAVELLSLILSLITSDAVSLDLATHRYLITLCGNLLSGIALKNLKTVDMSEKNDATEKMWNLFDSMEINNFFELLSKHTMRLLNIYIHVINDIQVPVYGKSSTLSSFPAAPSLSPRKKLIPPDHKPKERSEKVGSNLLKIGKEPYGAFYNLPHYMKLHEILKVAHVNYNSTIDVDASQMYLGLLNALLEVLSQILEIASTYEARKIAEEILGYLESTLTLSVTMSVKCVQQLWKSVFGMNLSARYDELENSKGVDDKLKKNFDELRRGLYDRCLQKPIRLMADLIKTMGNNCRDSECNTGRVVNSTPNPLLAKSKDSSIDRKFALVFKSLRSNSQKAFFPSIIRIFEPMVIKSLILYTTTNSVACQCQVLSLLSQLIQFHVNYCLLDTDKTFFNFVLTQFPYIEAFHIPSVDLLLPKVFNFLVPLSYEKFHSKMIIDIREIIKLCDGLMASGQAHSTHCIPALIPVAEDIFLARSSSIKSISERAELETTREYLMSMMLRLIDHHEIIMLLAECLKECRHDEDGEEKWRKWSRMIIDALLSALSLGKIVIEMEKMAIALIKLFSVISPVVLRPIDSFLKLLFTFPPAIEESSMKFQRWLGMINVILIVIISYTKEDNLLARLSELRIYMTDLMHILDPPETLLIIADSADPLNATNIENSMLTPEEIFAIFIFRVISLSAEKIRSLLNSVDYCENLLKANKDDNYMIIRELSFFLQLCIHIFESRTHPKITLTVINYLKKGTILPVDKLNKLMIEISARNLTVLTMQWVHLMTILQNNDELFWSKFMGDKNSTVNELYVDKRKLAEEMIGRRSKTNIDSKIVSQCSTILFCDYICDNLHDVDSLSFLIMNYLEETMNLENELPVRDFVTAVHKNSSASGLLIQGISAKCQDLSQPAFVKKLLRSLECAQENQSGALLLILIPRFIVTSHVVLAKMAVQICHRRAEILLNADSDQVLEQLSKDDVNKLMETLQTLKLTKKYGTLVNLLNKLAVKFYDMSPLELAYCRPFNPQTIKNIELDKQWFISQIKLRCSNSISNSELFEFAKLLSKLNFEDCYDTMTSKDFNIGVLEECVKFGARITVEQHINKIIFGAKDDSSNDCSSPLYRSTVICLSNYVKNIVELMPKNHHVYEPNKVNNAEKNGRDSKVLKYAAKFRLLMEDPIYWEQLFAIIPAITAYGKSIREFGDKEVCHNTSEMINNEDLAKFSVLCLETIHWIIYADESSIKNMVPHDLDTCLTCAAELLKNEDISKIFGSENRYSWVCSAANTLIKIAEYFLLPRNVIDNCRRDNRLIQLEQLKIGHWGLTPALTNDSTRIYAKACLQMAFLVSWLEKSIDNEPKNIPKFIKDTMITLIVIVSRQELVNSFILTPPVVWTAHGWAAEGSGKTLCRFPLLLSASDSNFLQELDVLQQFVYRITLLGWTSRLQFEEIWMVLLSVLSASSSENKSMESDDVGNNEATILAVQGITRLLMQTFLLPYPGSPINSFIIHHSRDPPLSLKKSTSRRLFVVQDLLSWKYASVVDEMNIGSDYLSRDFGSNSLDTEQLFTRGNIERDRITGGYDCYAYSQLSVQYLWSSCSLHEDKLSMTVIKLREKRDKALSSASLDLDSCVMFLIELYSRWLSPSSKTFPRLLNEVIKSIILISDLFGERSQFQWMFDTCWEIERFHPIDDEILHHSLILAICKSAAVLVPLDIESLDKVKRVIETGLKFNYFPCQIATLHGILYILQSAVQANCEETMNVIQPLVVKYVQTKVDVAIVNESEEYQRIIWALVFFLLEHTDDPALDSEAPDVLDLSITLSTHPNISIAVHRTIIQGFERLIATRNVTGRVADQLVKLSLDRLKQPSILYVLPALRLLLTCMYTEAADKLNQLSTDEILPDIDPEALIRTIERTATIFDRIKRGYPMEVKILCAVVSEILGDFFPPFEILTKVIGEFLLPQQPHQKLIASVVFKVCERITDNPQQLALLQDWVIFSLPNFIQSLPLVTSTWCLSCFFVSASTNPWLRAFFPYVQSRIGKYEYEDKKILCIAAMDFYRKLSNESQKQAFAESFSAAGTEPDSPFSDIMTSLQVATNHSQC